MCRPLNVSPGFVPLVFCPLCLLGPTRRVVVLSCIVQSCLSSNRGLMLMVGSCSVSLCFMRSPFVLLRCMPLTVTQQKTSSTILLSLKWTPLSPQCCVGISIRSSTVLLTVGNQSLTMFLGRVRLHFKGALSLVVASIYGGTFTPLPLALPGPGLMGPSPPALTLWVVRLCGSLLFPPVRLFRVLFLTIVSCCFVCL